jgi:hypothetical protein
VILYVAKVALKALVENKERSFLMHIRLNFFSPEKLTVEDRCGVSNRNLVEFGFLTDIYPIVVGKDGVKRAVIAKIYNIDTLRVVDDRLHGHVILQDAELESLDCPELDTIDTPIPATTENVDALVKGTLTLDIPKYSDAELSLNDINSLELSEFHKSPAAIVIHSIDLIADDGVLINTFYPEQG